MRFILPIALLAALAIPAAAHADTFTITGSGAGNSGSVAVTAIPNGPGSFLITNFGSPITLLAPGAFHNNDDLLFPGSASLVDSQGFAFTDTIGNTGFNVDVFAGGPGTYFAFFKDSDGVEATVPVTFTVTGITPAIPEPASLFLLGTGMLGLLWLARRRVVA
jgi:hypothetical protein